MKRRLLLSAVVIFVIFAFALVANEAAAQDLNTNVEPGYASQISIEFGTTSSITGPILGKNGAPNLPAEPLLLLELGGLLVILGLAVAVTMSARRETRSEGINRQSVARD